MLSIFFVVIGLLVMFGSLFASAFVGTQLAVLGLGTLMLSVIIELRKLNNFNERRQKAVQNQKQRKTE